MAQSQIHKDFVCTIVQEELPHTQAPPNDTIILNRTLHHYTSTLPYHAEKSRFLYSSIDDNFSYICMHFLWNICASHAFLYTYGVWIYGYVWERAHCNQKIVHCNWNGSAHMHVLRHTWYMDFRSLFHAASLNFQFEMSTTTTTISILRGKESNDSSKIISPAPLVMLLVLVVVID